MKTPSLKRRAFDGIKWQVCSNMVSRIIATLAVLVLARFLGPSVFGLYALTISIVNSFELFKSMGLDTALIRRGDDFEVAADTAFYIIPAIGLFLYAILSLSAPAIAAVFRNQEVALTIRVLGLAFVCNCFTRVPSALLERRMDFKWISIAEASTQVLFSVLSVALALAGFGVWSLVSAYVIKMFLYMLLIWRFSGWRPKWRFSLPVALDMFNFGKFIFFGSLVYFLRMNLDNLLVGGCLGITALGLYALAFNISSFSYDFFGTKVHRVIFPAFASIGQEKEQLTHAFLKTLKYLALVALPVGVGIITLGNDFLAMVYGPKWLAAGGALKILAVGGIFNTLPAGVLSVLLAKGRSLINFWITAVPVIMFVLFIRPAGAFFGIEGVSVVVALSGLVALLISFFWMRKLLSVSVSQIVSSFRTAVFASAVMGAGIQLFKNIVPFHRGLSPDAVIAFLLILLLSAAVYGGSIFVFERGLITEFRETVQ
ncbi:MAG: lipopolysaccharide biosynthesis protein [Deltaproteobacteria bacterium]